MTKTRAGPPLVPVRVAMQQALEDGVAPPVVLEACHERSLQVVRIEDLREYAAAPS